MSSTYEAPRFCAWFERLERRDVMLVKRDDWDRMKAVGPDPVLIDVRQTPLASLDAKRLLAATAERRSDYEVLVKIYREDLADALPVNTDRYLVWERLPDHRDFPTMVNTASTEDNANMRGFLSEHVFLVKEPAGDDHWLPVLPPTVKALIQRA